MKSSSQLQNNNEIELLPQEYKYNVKMNADEFMKKHVDLDRIDSEESLKKNIENIFKIINTPNYDEII